MDAGSDASGVLVCSLAVSRDGKWIVSGTSDGLVKVWSTESYGKAMEFEAHLWWVRAIDVSPDGTRIVTGSDDDTVRVCVWSLSTGQRLLGPWEYDYCRGMAAVKFSPDGCFIATAMWGGLPPTLRVYDSQSGRLVFNILLTQVIDAPRNSSIVWAKDARQLFALSEYGSIYRLDVAGTKTMLSTWPVQYNNQTTRCIASASNGAFIAVSAGSSVSFWNPTTREQIGSVIEFTHDIWCMAISPNDDLTTAGDNKISIRSLRDILPSSYFSVVSGPTSNV